MWKRSPPSTPRRARSLTRCPREPWSLIAWKRLQSDMRPPNLVAVVPPVRPLLAAGLFNRMLSFSLEVAQPAFRILFRQRRSGRRRFGRILSRIIRTEGGPIGLGDRTGVFVFF